MGKWIWWPDWAGDPPEPGGCNPIVFLILLGVVLIVLTVVAFYLVPIAFLILGGYFYRQGNKSAGLLFWVLGLICCVGIVSMWSYPSRMRQAQREAVAQEFREDVDSIGVDNMVTLTMKTVEYLSETNTWRVTFFLCNNSKWPARLAQDPRCFDYEGTFAVTFTDGTQVRPREGADWNEKAVPKSVMIDLPVDCPGEEPCDVKNPPITVCTLANIHGPMPTGILTVCGEYTKTFIPIR